MAADKKLYVVVNGAELIEAHDTRDAASIAAGERGDDFSVHEVAHMSSEDSPAKKLSTKSPTKKTAKRSSPVDDEEEGEGEAAPAKKKTKSAPKEKKEKKEAEVPFGMATVFFGHSFTFIGTFTKHTRDILAKCVENHNGTVSKKLDNVDWIVQGKSVGKKQEEDIRENNRTTITEDEFLVFLATGEPPN